MGSSTSTIPVDPNAPIERVDVGQMLANNAEAKQVFLRNMRARGFCVLSLDPNSTEAINNYVDAGKVRFKLIFISPCKNN
jgi:hypothetical protein